MKIPVTIKRSPRMLLTFTSSSTYAHFYLVLFLRSSYCHALSLYMSLHFVLSSYVLILCFVLMYVLVLCSILMLCFVLMCAPCILSCLAAFPRDLIYPEKGYIRKEGNAANHAFSYTNKLYAN